MSDKQDSPAITPTPQVAHRPSPQGPKPSVSRDEARTLKAVQSYVEEQRAKDTSKMEDMLQSDKLDPFPGYRVLGFYPVRTLRDLGF